MSIFPERLRCGGKSYRLQYDPDNPATIMPDLRGGHVEHLTCDIFRVTGQDGKPKMLQNVRLHYVIPPRLSNRRMLPGKSLMGIRAYDIPPDLSEPGNPKPTIDATFTPPQEMLIYIEEPGANPTSNLSQEFWDAVFGEVSQRQVGPQVDTQWAREIFSTPSPASEGIEGDTEGESPTQTTGTRL